MLLAPRKNEHQIRFQSAIQNETFIANVIAIHHLRDSGEDYFFLVRRDSIVVYWWDGMSLIYYDTLTARSRVRSFGVAKRQGIQPLIVSSDGRGFTLHYKKYGAFPAKVRS